MKHPRQGPVAHCDGASSFSGPSSRRTRGSLALLLALMVLAGLPVVAVAEDAPRRERGVDVSGRWGIGFSDDAAPLGVRYLWDRRYGVDLGMGLEFFGGRTENSRLVLDAGFLYALAPGDRLNLFLRPGVRFTNLGRDGGDATTIQLGAHVEFEVFLAGNFSVGARTGVFLATLSPPGGGGDRVSLGTDAALWTAAGFHYYLPASE